MDKIKAKSIGNKYFQDIDVFYADPVINQVDMEAEFFGTLEDGHVVMMIPVSYEDLDPEKDVVYEIMEKTYRPVYTNSREELDERFDEMKFLEMLQAYLNKRYDVKFNIEDYGLSDKSLVFENKQIRLMTGVRQFHEYLRSYPTQKEYLYERNDKKNNSGCGGYLTPLTCILKHFDEDLKRKEIEQDSLF